MDNIPQQQPQPRQFTSPRFSYDPGKALPFDRPWYPLLYADMVRHRRTKAPEARLTKALAWFGIGLGLVQLLAPRAFARSTGFPDWPWLLRATGARELVINAGLLTQPGAPVWRQVRVAGDAMDAAMLGAAMFAPSSRRSRLAATAAIASGIMALEVRAGAVRRRKPSEETMPGTQGARRVIKAITVNCAPSQCYSYWRNVESFPNFMKHVESVRVIDDRHSHWRAKGPAGTHVEWDAEITEDKPERMIAWQSVPGSQVQNRGMVRFEPAPGGKGTVIEVEMEYRPPAGTAGAAVAMLFGEEPSQQIEGDLRRFKQIIETGEIPSTKGQPHGPRSFKARLFNRGVEQ